jgi:hypothetical protein
MFQSTSSDDASLPIALSETNKSYHTQGQLKICKPTLLTDLCAQPFDAPLQPQDAKDAQHQDAQYNLSNRDSQ